jgi:periplasmic protein TonB
MVVIRQPQKLESRLFPATVISLGLHCLVAALLFYCLQERSLLTLPQTIISVDIRTLEPEKEKRKKATPPDPAKAQSKLPSSALLPARTVHQSVQKTVAVEPPVLSPAPAQVTPVESLPVAQPVQVMSESMARPLSPPIPALEPSRVDSGALTGKGTPAPIAGIVEMKREQSYLAVLKEIIERNKEYPLMARKGGMEGTVRIRCSLWRSGELREAAVIKPSGYTILDNAALRAVRAVGRFPLVPSEIKGETYSFVAPLTFRLGAD